MQVQLITSHVVLHLNRQVCHYSSFHFFSMWQFQNHQMVRNYSTAQRFLALIAHKKRVKKSVCAPEFFSNALKKNLHKRSSLVRMKQSFVLPFVSLWMVC